MIPRRVHVALNGSRRPSAHPVVPATPDRLAAEAVDAVRAGAVGVHLHPKDASGADTLEATFVADAVAAVRARVDVPVSVTTGAWIDAAPGRLRDIGAWTVLPDAATVNWHENGAVEIADLLLSRGVAVEAGLHTVEAVASWRRWPRRSATSRILLEVVESASPAAALASARDLLGAPGDAGGVPVLLHGEETGCWEVLDEALRRGLETRIGLEDTLLRRDGTPARDNAELVRDALS